jgi:hypothetical protein
VNKELPRKWSAWASGTVSLSLGFDLFNGRWIKFGRATAGTNAERPWKEKHTMYIRQPLLDQMQALALFCDRLSIHG